MVSKKDVQYIANLARIHFEETEVDILTKNLADILHYVEKLEKLDVSNVQPTSHIFPVSNVFRDDVVGKSITQDEALQNAPSNIKGAFKVPKVIE